MCENVKIRKDLKGNLVVQIDEIIFKNKQNIDWKEVEKYARKYINEVCYIATDKEEAQKGWYRYTSRISLPIYKENDIEKYNVYLVTVLVRHAANGKKYLYDLVNIKKEAEYPV